MDDLPDVPLLRYYAALDTGDWQTASSMWAVDALFYVRALNRSCRRFEGRDAITEYFRGHAVTPWRHEVLSAVMIGSECFLEGRGGGYATPYHAFLAHASFTGDGLIQRYVVFSEIPDESGVLDATINYDNRPRLATLTT